MDATGIQIVAALVEADSFEGANPASVLTATETTQLADALSASGCGVYRVRDKEDLAACLQRPYAA
jgi:hypothetical protein